MNLPGKTILISISFLACLLPATAQFDPGADEFHKQVIEKVVQYNNEVEALSARYRVAKQNRSADTALIRAKRLETVNKCFLVPQEFIRAYPRSLLCIEALRMLGEGRNGAPVGLRDLRALFSSLSDSVKNSVEGREYEGHLSSWERLRAIAASVSGIKTITRQLALHELYNNQFKKVSIKAIDPAGAELSKDELEQKLKDATLIINMACCDSTVATTHNNPATGYVISDNGLVVTNFHVVKEYAGKERYKSLSVTTAEGQTYPVTAIMSASESDDLAILQIQTNGDKLKSLPLGTTAKNGSPVYVMSHPNKLFYKLTSGTVTGNSTDEFFGKPCAVMTISAAFTIGSSGGPVVDQCGDVIGTVSRIREDGSGITTQITIPVNVLKQLLIPSP